MWFISTPTNPYDAWKCEQARVTSVHDESPIPNRRALPGIERGISSMCFAWCIHFAVETWLSWCGGGHSTSRSRFLGYTLENWHVEPKNRGLDDDFRFEFGDFKIPRWFLLGLVAKVLMCFVGVFDEDDGFAIRKVTMFGTDRFRSEVVARHWWDSSASGWWTKLFLTPHWKEASWSCGISETTG